MLDKFEARNRYDKDENPAGGWVKGNGIAIRWQKGPLGRGKSRKKPNGAFVETVIAAVINRLDFYQGSKFACAENQAALDKLTKALKILNGRTKSRETRKVEGTHKV